MGHTTAAPSGRRSQDFWIVVDGEGFVEARLEAAGREAAERIAWGILPELEADGKVIGWRDATEPQRKAAKRALKINVQLCLRRGLDLDALRRDRSDGWTAQLQSRFVRAGVCQ